MSELKPIPKDLTKSVLQKMYFSINAKEVNQSINDIKQELRGEKFNPCDKKIRPDELRLFVIEYGNPIGYSELISEKERLELKGLRRNKNQTL